MITIKKAAKMLKMDPGEKEHLIKLLEQGGRYRVYRSKINKMVLIEGFPAEVTEYLKTLLKEEAEREESEKRKREEAIKELDSFQKTELKEEAEREESEKRKREESEKRKREEAIKELDSFQKTKIEESANVPLKAKTGYRYGSKEQLCLFFNEHEQELSEEDYNSLLNEMSFKYNSFYVDCQVWRESKDELCFFKKGSQWCWHDETIYYSEFALLSKTEYTRDWFLKDSSDDSYDFPVHRKRVIPCEEERLYRNRSFEDRKTSWWYKEVTDKEYLLLEPFGLDGVWFYHIYLSESR